MTTIADSRWASGYPDTCAPHRLGAFARSAFTDDPDKYAGHKIGTNADIAKIAKCAYCDRRFDKSRRVGMGSMGDLDCRSRAGPVIINAQLYCDFACDHTGVISEYYPGGAQFWTCCGAQPGQTWGCRCVVLPHLEDETTGEGFKEKNARARDARAQALDIRPQVMALPKVDSEPEEKLDCYYCKTKFYGSQQPSRPAGIEELKGRERDGRLAIRDDTRYCDFRCGHPGRIQETYICTLNASAIPPIRKTYRFYTCCRAEVGTSWGCECVVVSHFNAKNTQRDLLMANR